MGPTSIKNAYCHPCQKRGFRSGYCQKRRRVIREVEILPCMFDGANFLHEKAPLKEGQIVKSWDDFYANYKKTVEDVVEPLYYCAAFSDFLKKVDKTGQGGLIDELFDGKEDTYVDSPGDFHRDPEQYEHSIIYNYVANCNEANLLKLFGFWCANLRKCYDWTYPKRLRSPLKLRKGRIR